MVDGDVVALGEGDAEELFGGVEDAFFEDAGELEVGLDGLFVEVVAGFAKLFGVEAPVPGLEFEGVGLGVDEGLEVFGFLGDERWWLSLPAR